jgi:hypothetical protein
VPRLDEAKLFVKRALKEARKPSGKPWKNSDLLFVGHSLGGWIAEGVGLEYPGSQIATLQTGGLKVVFSLFLGI